MGFFFLTFKDKMEPVQLFWWIAFGLVIVSSVMCAQKNIEPNPLYRTVRRMAAGGEKISSFVSTTSSCVGLLASLLFGVLAYYLCMRCMCVNR